MTKRALRTWPVLGWSWPYRSIKRVPSEWSWRFSSSAGRRSAPAPLAGENSAPAGEVAQTRNHSIDAFRIIANWAVVFVHTAPFMAATFSPAVRFDGELLDQFVRVATPFFFLASGYFFAVSLSRGTLPLPLATRLVQRLILFFLFWSVVYICLPVEVFFKTPQAGYWSAVHVMVARLLSLRFLVNGTAFHLWFLPALSSSLVMLAIACRLRWERALWVFAAALYLFGLIAGAYKATPFGLNLGINTRNGPFFSTLFVVSGFMIQRLGWRVTVRRSLMLIGLGIVLRIAELLWVTGKYGTSPSDIDYLLGTYPFGVGIFLLLLSTKGLGQIRWLVTLSRYSAGVYCAHVLIAEPLTAGTAGIVSPLWEIARPFAALALTFALVMALARIRFLKPVLT